MDFVDLIANMTGLMSITVSNVSGSWPIQGSFSLFVYLLFSFPCVNSVYFSLIKVDAFVCFFFYIVFYKLRLFNILWQKYLSYNF